MDWTGHVHGKHGLSTHFVIVKRGLKTCKHFITSNIFEFAVPSEANCYGGGGGGPKLPDQKHFIVTVPPIKIQIIKFATV